MVWVSCTHTSEVSGLRSTHGLVQLTQLSSLPPLCILYSLPRQDQPVEGLDPLTSWSQTHFLPASFPNLISAASALHKCQRVVCYIMSWTEKRGPLRGNRKCFIVKASSVYKNSCIWMAQVQNIHSAKNAIQASRGANWARPTVFCFGMELFIPLMIRIRAGWEQNCVL